MSFEETFPRYPFSDLVRFGIMTARFCRRFLDRNPAAHGKTEAPDSEVAAVTYAQTASIV